MKNTPLFRTAITLALALLLGTAGLQAQSASPETGHFAVRVSGLTSATRDALTRDLMAQGQARVVFACVPAGILMFESLNGIDNEHMRQAALPMLQQRAAHATIAEVSLSLREAEAECAEVRNR